jgi:hypothetical protein
MTMRDEIIEAMARAMAAEVGTMLHDEIHWPEFGPGYIEGATAALAAIEAMGFAIVPVEPTPEMEKAGWEVEELDTPDRVWRAMIEVGKV